MKNVLVTGGGGFVGKKIVQMLIKKGITCTVVGRNRYPDIEQLGITCKVGSITDSTFIDDCCKGIDTVFHVAALAGIWGKWEDYYNTNVVGTENVVAACKKQGVTRMVYTSTPSVVFNQENILKGDESLPYAETFLCHYPKSKIIAEKHVLGSITNTFSACAIRPHLIWGPGDPHLVPRLIEKGKNRKLKIVGEGNNLVDISYIDNVAHAHILAAENLCDSQSANGKAYFIGDEKPVELWKWINDLFIALDIPPIKKKVPFKTAYFVGTILEGVFKIFNLSGEPPMSRFVAEQLAKSHYFSHDKAKKDFGYVPIVSSKEGMNNLLNWINEK